MAGGVRGRGGVQARGGARVREGYTHLLELLLHVAELLVHLVAQNAAEDGDVVVLVRVAADAVEARVRIPAKGRGGVVKQLRLLRLHACSPTRACMLCRGLQRRVGWRTRGSGS